MRAHGRLADAEHVSRFFPAQSLGKCRAAGLSDAMPQDQTIANEHAKLFPEHSFAYVLDPFERGVKAKYPDRTLTKI
jgi:hypothetical protein